MSKEMTLLFVKFPEKGKVKTRLAADIGENHAVCLYKAFIEDIIKTLKKNNLPFKICFYPADSQKKLMNWLRNDFMYYPQIGEDLGERMKNAFIKTFSEGFQKAIIIGSDLPDLTISLINKAFDSLKREQAVIGPSYDGGYYLIGFRDSTFTPDIFHGINWSKETVLKETMKIFQELGISVHVLEEQRDIDLLNDIRSFFERNVSNNRMRASVTMSYIMKHKKEIFKG